MIWLIIVILVVVLDQLTKLIVEGNISFGSSIPVINGFFYLSHWKNTGAAWGIFQNGRMFFIPLTIIVSIVLIYYLYKADSRFLKISLSFIIGGALGNFIDRVWRTSVVDFLEFHFGSYIFPIFNVADCFLVVGTFLLGFYLLFIYNEKKQA